MKAIATITTTTTTFNNKIMCTVIGQFSEPYSTVNNNNYDKYNTIYVVLVS